MRILGIDPGSRVTGFGCVRAGGRQLIHVTDGIFRLESSRGRSSPMELRLKLLFEGLNEIILECRPDVLVIEKAFLHKNVMSSLKLGQVRGVVLLCGALHGLEVVEYHATEVKASVAGSGQADKLQVQRGVQLLVGKREFVAHDASDALALALCHGLRAAARPALSQLRAAAPRASGKGRARRMTIAESLGLSGSRPRRKPGVDANGAD
ncbi:MAG: crossover junction endodeoxyribonuclease RuvC [Bdellovibrionales bacterium]|nr:crossover junction endodeoxyribonuclease RuvC [Bdellovibrionales bacterium]